MVKKSSKTDDKKYSVLGVNLKSVQLCISKNSLTSRLGALVAIENILLSMGEMRVTTSSHFAHAIPYVLLLRFRCCDGIYISE